MKEGTYLIKGDVVNTTMIVQIHNLRKGRVHVSAEKGLGRGCCRVVVCDVEEIECLIIKKL